MVIQATDNPGNGAVARIASASVRITVLRNPNAPRFSSNIYNATISEYLSVQQSVIRVIATDDDPTGTPSGVVAYDIQSISYTPPNGFAQFVISSSEGSIYVSQPLTRDGVPNSFTLIVVASDQASIPKSATATVFVEIVRNQFRPTFDSPDGYSATVFDYYNAYRPLFTVTATDNDINVPLSAQTANAEFDYVIDPENAIANVYFDVSRDGTVFMKANFDRDVSTQFEFYVIAIDRSWRPLSSRARVVIDVTRTDISREVGFSIPTQTVSVVENVDIINSEPTIVRLDVVNENVLRQVRCDILLINGLTDAGGNNPSYNLFSVSTTTDGYNCELRISPNLDREVNSFWNVTIGVQEIDRVKRQVVDDPVLVYPSYAIAYVLVTVIDMNDNAPVFVYPTYPDNLVDRSFYVGAVPLYAQYHVVAVQLMATDADEGEYGRIVYQLPATDNDNEVLPLDLGDDGRIRTNREFRRINKAQVAFTATAYDNPSAVSTLRRSTETPVYINMIDNRHRFVLVLNTPIETVTSRIETIRQNLQNTLDRIVLIETVNYRRFISNGILDLNPLNTDVTFVVVNHLNRQYNLYENLDDPLNLITTEGDDDSQVIINRVRSALATEANVVLIRGPFPAENIQGFADELEAFGNIRRTKSYIWWTDDPWAGFVALAGIIIFVSIIALIILLYQWNRYSTYLNNYRVYHRNYEHQPDFTNPPSFLKEYETQTLDMYVPPDETVQELGEINVSFNRDESARRTGEVRKISTRNPVYDNSAFHVKVGQVHY